MSGKLKIDYKRFIEDNFSVPDRETLIPVDFKLNSVQDKYYSILNEEYAEMEGIREIVLKARQEGMSSFLLALFTVDFILRPYSVSICISHRKDSTDILFKKVKSYLTAYFDKLAQYNNTTTEKVAQQFLKSDNKNLIENAENNAVFYIGTAGAKVGGRGGTATNILFSECAFYQDTELITAQEIVVGTAQQVPQGKGKIFIESTANGEGNFYHELWERSNQFNEDGSRLSAYKPRFFGWDEFYTEEWVNEKKKEFPNERMFKQEYPKDPDEAFVTSGSPYFNTLLLDEMLKGRPQALHKGRFAPDGNWM